ncbi:uncharacterized protein LOC123016052 [Tribolium madens]|uniref:uncharacterized protein LOC123016052 n=1 Tax=Tribolium madens TaxID=41895 RepID=UPI001CF75775|nr:uncharacterized protein LOC123016052 [Tribolium madens]XP_044272183.1 uncharacterized protein LOC123016052 [Tribolium madens]
MWSAVVPADVESPAPSARSKHSATIIGENIYLLGGRNGNLPMKDFWKYNLISGKWQLLKPTGDRLPALQEHSTVAYKNCLYVFGGEVGFSAGTETPLWCYDIKTNNWKKIRTKKGVVTPKGRRGHTALVHRDQMLLYGGYQDLRGSCSELWAFHFETGSWHLLSTTPKNANIEALPPPRHKHSAVIHDDSMWVYGGMTDLQERGDLWKWNTQSKSWSFIKTKINPGSLHSHAVCKLPSSMLLFGGERGGHPTNELWKFSFVTETWEKIVTSGAKPQPRSESVAFSVSDFSLTEPTVTEKAVRLRSRTCISADRTNRHSSYLPNNRIAPYEKTYIFRPSHTNYTDGSDPTQTIEEKKSFLQEISKISQISKMNKCSYTVLTGCTTDSTESLLKQHASPHFDENEAISSKNAMVKSKSAYVIKKKVQVETETITREPISVPNFSVLTLPTPVLTPVEAAKLVYLDTDDENEILNEKCEFDKPVLEPPKRGESYSSHLGYADNPLYQHMMKLSEKENISSTSDYASIETMNRLSSASNYSVKTNTAVEEPRNLDKDGPFGFCNPNYLGPDIKALLDPSEKKQISKLLTHPESKDSEENLLELQEYKTAKVYFRASTRVPSDSQRTKEAKRRAHSAGRAESHKIDKNEADFDRIIDFVPLYVYVIGGKEHGQVTIFRRPISMWKLNLF